MTGAPVGMGRWSAEKASQVSPACCSCASSERTSARVFDRLAGSAEQGRIPAASLRRSYDRILALKRETMYLETEYETRANQQQLRNLNDVEFGYQAPNAGQYLENERQLAALGRFLVGQVPEADRAACGACGRGGRCALKWFSGGTGATLDVPARTGDQFLLRPGQAVTIAIDDGEVLRAERPAECIRILEGVDRKVSGGERRRRYFGL
mgnify:CR=1 FL=1